MMLFTHNVNKIKSVARKNGEIDGTCKQDFRVKEFFKDVQHWFMSLAP